MRLRPRLRRLLGRVRARLAPPPAPPVAEPAAPEPPLTGLPALATRFGLEPTALQLALLHANEVEAIVDAVTARPGGSFLVFGCGNDSRFWEQVNRDGTTAFLEDHPQWAEDVASKLTRADVHVVTYGTTRAQWRELLDDPTSLTMTLPPAVRDRRWDVVFVDGPAGFDDETPGRMKSIYEAARLVAPGGRVFVHDCEREVEDAYTARYLGEERVAVEITGHALLKGYAF